MLDVAFRATLDTILASDPIVNEDSCAMSERQSRHFQENFEKMKLNDVALKACVKDYTEAEFKTRDNDSPALAVICSRTRAIVHDVPLKFQIYDAGYQGQFACDASWLKKFAAKVEKEKPSFVSRSLARSVN